MVNRRCTRKLAWSWQGFIASSALWLQRACLLFHRLLWKWICPLISPTSLKKSKIKWTFYLLFSSFKIVDSLIRLVLQKSTICWVFKLQFCQSRKHNAGSPGSPPVPPQPHFENGRASFGAALGVRKSAEMNILEWYFLTLRSVQASCKGGKGVDPCWLNCTHNVQLHSSVTYSSYIVTQL